MPILITKKQKEAYQAKQAELARQAEEKRQEEALQVKTNAKLNLSKMSKQITRLDSFKDKYIQTAIKAKKLGDNVNYQNARSGLRLCIGKQRVLASMVSSLEIAMDTNDMNEIIGSFVEGINDLSSQMSMITSTVDFTKAQTAFNQAMAKNANQYAALDAFISTASDSIATLDVGDSGVSDKEIDTLINNAAADETNRMGTPVVEETSTTAQTQAELDKIINGGD
jgi:hypothetical protein